jgi:molybdopterin-guanine dinucleotide biosynthesis protein B
MKSFTIIGDCRSKANLMQRLVAHLTGEGLMVSTLKRVSDDIDLDRPGKDTYLQRQAGAHEIIIANSFRWALLHEEHESFLEPDAGTLIARLAPVDLILLEGFHLSTQPKLEVAVAGQNRRLQCLDDDSVLAVASDLPIEARVPRFDFFDAPSIARFILAHAVDSDRAISERMPA